MIYRAYIPGPPLSEFVELFWFYEGYTQPHAKERILPTGTTELVINLQDDLIRVYEREDTDRFRSYGGAVVCGPHSEFFVIDTAEQAKVIGVHFKLGGAFPFFKMPAGEFGNEHVPLDALWGTRAGTLRERLLEAPTPDDKFRILEQVLLAQVARPLARHPAVTFALHEFERVPHLGMISEVSDRVGFSQRRFIQVFRDQVGLTPKRFCRVRRFQEVLRAIGTGRQVEWASMALACGYYDQAHLIGEFRAFSGLNPTAYLAHRSEHLNHVPLLD
ncbi:MAG TPA: helix-turn-helix domain-containing protein [Isosphaeraceae bacterium]|jgi:AraC-like DNA-binding protein|nr:helix-turn-helix domain-containing protein [Isosphaeraceae bacterium]